MKGFTVGEIRAYATHMLTQGDALGVASLEEIGLASFPINATHKILKGKVQEAVARYLEA